MKLYYLVYHQYTKIVGVFDTLAECFSWKPQIQLEKPVLIREVRRFEDGHFEIHDIQTSEHHWHSEKLKNDFTP
jgi:hypothetical protein